MTETCILCCKKLKNKGLLTAHLSVGHGVERKEDIGKQITLSEAVKSLELLTEELKNLQVKFHE